MKYLLLFVSLSGMCGAASAEEKVELNPCEQSMLESVNAERARYGLPAFQVDPNLQQMARQHCLWMTNSYSMTHSRMNVAENIAMGQPNAYAVTCTWMNSSGHRANILNGGHRYIGLCGYTAPNGQVFWCQQFSGYPLGQAVVHAVQNVAQAATAPIRVMRGWFRGR